MFVDLLSCFGFLIMIFALDFIHAIYLQFVFQIGATIKKLPGTETEMLCIIPVEDNFHVNK